MEEDPPQLISIDENLQTKIIPITLLTGFLGSGELTIKTTVKRITI